MNGVFFVMVDRALFWLKRGLDLVDARRLAKRQAQADAEHYQSQEKVRRNARDSFDN